MTRYERRSLAVVDDRLDVEGRIVHVLEAPRAGRNTITALVELPETEMEEPPVPATFGDVSEGVDDSGEKGVYYCQGTKADGGQCTREVDEPGDYCFQHP